MPPRKSNASVASNANEDAAGGSTNPGPSAGASNSTPSKEREPMTIEDLNIPRSIVQRIAKGALPEGTSIQKDAMLAIQRSATLFVSYLAAQANTTTQSTNRRTVPPQAVLDALEECEFPSFVPRVDAELRKFNDTQTNKRNDYRKRIKDRESGGGDGGEGDGAGENKVPEGTNLEDTSSMMESNSQLHAEQNESLSRAAGESPSATRRRAGELMEMYIFSDGLERLPKRPRKSRKPAEGNTETGEFANGANLAPDTAAAKQKGKRRSSTAAGGDGVADEDGTEVDEELTQDEEEAEEDADEEDGDDGVEEDEEDEEEEEEEAEDDEDEYPDAGHRAESLGMEDPEADGAAQRRRSGYGYDQGVMAGRRGEASGVPDDDDDSERSGDDPDDKSDLGDRMDED